MSDATDEAPSNRLDPWLVTVITAGVAAFLLVLLLFWLPRSSLTWALGAAVFVAAVVVYFNPRHWLKRQSAACLALAGASAICPTILGRLELPQGFIEIATGTSPWVALGFGVLATLFAWMDRPHPMASGQAQITIGSGGRVEPRDVIQTGDHAQVTIHNSPERTAANPDVIAIAEMALKRAEEKGAIAQRAQGLEDENRELRLKLAAALERTEVRAKTGDPQAREAIDEARRTGDLTQLDASLDAEFTRREAQIKEGAADWFELCKESATVALLRGDISKARTRLEMVLRFFPDDRESLNMLGQLHHLQGRLDDAESAFRRLLALCTDDEAAQAAAYGNLGVVMRTRGDLDGAESAQRKALQINEKLERLEAIASNCGNLGNILRIRGDLQAAEEMYRKSLQINTQLEDPEGVTMNLSDLANLSKARGDLIGAEAMKRRSLHMNEMLGRLQGIAIDSSDLGNLLRIRGDLDGAEAMHQKALQINEKLGHLEGMADAFGGLGSVRLLRNELGGAEAMYRKALAIEEKLGRPYGIANAIGNFGNILNLQGDLEGAEAKYREALAIEEQLGRIEGMAIGYLNLGRVMASRRKKAEAQDLWTKSRDLYAKLGATHMVDELQRWIDRLPG